MSGTGGRNGWQRWAVRLTVVVLGLTVGTALVNAVIGMRDHVLEVRQMHAELRRMQDSLNARHR